MLQIEYQPSTWMKKMVMLRLLLMITLEEDSIDINDVISLVKSGEVLEDSTNRIGGMYQPRSFYSAEKLGRIYQLWTMSFWILHSNVLIYDGFSGWIPRFRIEDSGRDLCHWRNRVSWLVLNNNSLLLILLDTCGGGSGDGYISSYSLQDDKQWVFESCYDYHNRHLFQEIVPEYYQDIRYERWTRQLDELDPAALSECEGNVEFTYYL